MMTVANASIPDRERCPRPKHVHVESLETPILLIVFNRPDSTKAVFESIRSVRPRYLYVAADGPRPNVETDRPACSAARQIATAADWPCEVRTRFLHRNIGCGRNMSSAITWFFENVKEGIILEDDCVPSRSFYAFCGELLEYYRDDPWVMHIGGDNFQYGRVRGKASYYFSRFPHTWGWATWSRAWASYDFSLHPQWELRDVWSPQWQLSIEHAGGVAIVPNANLVKNVGFGASATHTTTLERASSLQAHDIPFPLTHPVPRAINAQADRFTYYVHFRRVRHPNWIWAYRLWDWCYAMLRVLKRRIWARKR